MRVRFDNAGLDRIDRAVHDYVEDIADDVLRNMRANCPVDTGTLKADLGSETHGTTARIGSNLDYAIYVEEGTAPHVIEPLDAGALYWPGAAHPVKRVNHPGTEATHFMKLSLYEAERP